MLKEDIGEKLNLKYNNIKLIQYFIRNFKKKKIILVKYVIFKKIYYQVRTFLLLF
jgi:hypothetical protein